MIQCKRKCNWLVSVLLCIPLLSFAAATPVKSIVIFGDSMSDNGNTTHLLKSLRKEESPAYLVAPLKIFILNKMVEFANDYYVPQMVLDAGVAVVTDFFDNELGPYIADLVGRVRLVPILPGKPYWKSRFSNGRVWSEYLAKMLVLNKEEETYTNKAFGGSWAATYDYQLTVWNLIRHPIGTIKTLIVGKLIPPSLGLTVQAYLLEHPEVDSDSVYFIYTGANDYLNILQFEDNYNPAIMSSYIDNVVGSLGSSVNKLIQAGAKRFVIMGIAHLGDTPRYVNTTDREVLNAASELHNNRLQAKIEEWKQSYPNVDFLFINTEQYLEKALLNPAEYGFSNVKEACIDVKLPMFDALRGSAFANNPVLHYAQILNYTDKQFGRDEKNYHVCDNPQNYLFWDEIHPSTRAHSYLAYETCLEMKAHGYQVTCQLMDSEKS